MWASSLLERLATAAPSLLPAILAAAIKGVVILSLTAMAASRMRRASAAARHLAWFLGTVSLLVLPILSALLPGWHVLPGWTTYDTALSPQTPRVVAAPAPTASVPDTQLPLVVTPPASQTPVSPPALTLAPSTPISVPPAPAAPPLRFTWPVGIVVAWLTGAALHLVYVATGIVSLWWLQRRSSRITSGSWPILLREVCRQLRFRRPVELISSPQRAMPMTWGLWRTRLLLPEDAANWTPEQRRAVLLHEIAHASRLDCLTQFVTQIACAVHWFNPLVWLASRRMQAERELACDDLVLRTGAKASAYAEQLLHIASEMPAVRFSAAAIAMARPSKLEGRLRAILDTGRNRRLAVRTAIGLSLVIGVSALTLSALRADDPPRGLSYQPVIRWATQHGWKSQWVTETNLESKWGAPGAAWRDIPFTLSKEEEADAQACISLAGKARTLINDKAVFSDPATRTALEDLLKRRPGYFYAEFLLAQWHRDYGDTQQAGRLFDASYRHAPVIIVQRYELADGSPLANTRIASFTLECNRVQNHSLDPSLELPYFNLKTDADGCIYLPVYDTVYRTDNMSYPAGYSVAFAKLGWFETSHKVGLLPVAIVTPQPGDFIPAASPEDAPTATATLPGDNRVELLAISAYPDPQNAWWLPDGSPSVHRYETGEPGTRPWPAENGRRFVFRFSKTLDPDSRLQFRFSAPTTSQSNYVTVRKLDKPYVLFTVFPTHPEKVTIRLGQTSGPWKTLAQYGPGDKRVTGDVPSGFVVKDVRDVDKSTSELTLAHPPTDLELRVFAIDTDNKAHPVDMNWFGRTGTTTEDYFRFERLPLARISSFRLEARENKWVEFGNIALTPGAPAVPSSQPGATQPAQTALTGDLPQALQLLKTPAQPAVIATAGRAKLPCGATVELAGVTENSSTAKPFWRADGSPLEHRPEHFPDRAQWAKLDQPGNDFMILVNGLGWSGRQSGDYEVLSRIQPQPGPGNGAVSSTWHDSILPPIDSPDGPRYSDVYVLSQSFSKAADRARIEFGLAAGPWETIATDPIDGQGGQALSRQGIGGTNLDVSFGVPYIASFPNYKPLTVHLTVAHNVPSGHQVRVIAMLADGSEAVGDTQISDGHVQQMQMAFRRGPGAREQDMVAIKDIKAFRLQSRPFQWADFRDIALSARPPGAAGGDPASQPASTHPAASPAPGGAFDGIINRDNDPDLAKALTFDSEYNSSKHLPDAQHLAEKHYLAYLGHATDSAMRARVYVQLGALFATNYHAEFGEAPDYAKSVEYMNKALAEEPQRIGWATLRARLFQVTPLQSRKEQQRLRAKNLEWLQSIDERQLRELWLPAAPGQRPTDDQVRSFLRNLANVVEAEVENSAASARALTAPASLPSPPVPAAASLPRHTARH